MLRSMTGFGAAARVGEGLRCNCELRTVNARSFKLAPRVPDVLFPHLTEIEQLLQQRIRRGTVFLNIRAEPVEPEPGYRVDRQAIRDYLQDLDGVRRELRLRGEVTLDILVGLPGVLRPTNGPVGDPRSMWAVVEPTLDEAIDALLVMRDREGAALRQAVDGHRAEVTARLDLITTHLPETIPLLRDRMKERIEQLLPEGLEVDRDALAREVAVQADRSDVTEELARLRSHLDQVEDVVTGDAGGGRALEFLVQEMFREANTMASKIADSGLLRHVLAVKTEIDRIRELVQNVE